MTSSSSPATMDSNGFCQIGRYGTIALMKRQDSNAAVTAFGIDSDQLTFGRDPTCGVRLYYPDVSLVHCKIVFEEHKAFLVVLGANGLFVDGCKVYPNTSSSSNSSPTIIPLTNNSEFEIHGKRFRFTYPPKELRPALYASPARPANRALRLSMIQSTQVFSPRPLADPRENLRILKSPIKNTFKSPYKSGLSTPLRSNPFATSKYAYQSPVKSQPVGQTIEEGRQEEDEEEEDSIILVDGNHPRVVEDEKDLVILEDIEVPLNTGVSQSDYHAPQPHVPPPPPQTPVRKRSLSRNTLHRAVLIRSAQRAVLKAELDEREREQEEEEEEMEVLDAVASDTASESDEEEASADEEFEYQEEEVPLAGNEEDASDEDENEDDRRGRTEDRKTQKLSWRKSLERLWPFRSSSAGSQEEDEDDENEEDGDGIGEDVQAEEQDENQGVPTPFPPQQAPARRPLGSFMTPQVHPRSKASTSNTIRRQAPGLPEASHSAQEAIGAGRYSLGGGEARRVVQNEQVWKVRDIVVPEDSGAATSTNTQASSPFIGPGIPGRVANGTASPARPSPRKVVNEEERKAIQERRRSALREVGTFFPSGVPGMGSPIKPLGWSPAKASSGSSSTSGSMSSALSSPTKPITLVKREDDEDEAEEAIDTRSLLERMKETVEGMKRRRSLAPATPVRRNNLATPAREMSLGLGSRPSSPSKAAAVTMLDVAEEEEEGEGEEKENLRQVSEEGQIEVRAEEPVFSLLRPGVLEEVRAREEADEALTVPAEEDEDIAMDVTDDPAPLVVTVPVLAGEGSPVPDDPEVDNEQTLAPTPDDSSADETIARPVRSKLKTPARRTKAKLVDDDTAPSDDTAPPPLPKPTLRRGRRAAAQPEENSKPSAPAPTSAPAKRGRKAAIAEPEEAAVAVPPPRRGRKLAVEPEEAEEKVAPVKKGRKVAMTRDDNESGSGADSGAAAPSKRAVRKTATTTAPPDAEDTAEPAQRRGRTPRAAATAIPVRRTTARGKNADESSGGASGSGPTRRGTKVKPIEVEDEVDPLDSIDGEEAVAVKPPKGRRKAVKEEAVEEALETVVAAPTRSRAKPTALKTPAVKTRTTTKKAPATAPAAVQQDVNKENAPDTEGASVVDTEEPVKVRVSRTTRKAASGTSAPRSAKVKREEPEDDIVAEPEAPRSRVMRATRARTRT